MSKFKIIFLISLVLASVTASLMIHRQTDIALRDRAALLQQQSQQLADLKTEQQRLSNLVARATDAPVTNYSTELASLRAEAEVLRKQTNELAQQSRNRRTPQPSQSASKPETHTPEYNAQMRQALGTKSVEARDIGYAMTEYAGDHQNQFPDGLDQIAPYLAKANRVLSGTNQFEIIFHGSLDQLSGIPEISIAAVRETQTWLTPDGRPVRVYGMIGGIGQAVTSDDNFQSWEAEHVIWGIASNSAR